LKIQDWFQRARESERKIPKLNVTTQLETQLPLKKILKKNTTVKFVD
jgi:hypothetical protein